MKIGKHAVRRYKKRIGGRTASKERIVRDIQKQLKLATKKTLGSVDGQYRIETPKFIAVCDRGVVVTILPPNAPKGVELSGERL